MHRRPFISAQVTKNAARFRRRGQEQGRARGSMALWAAFVLSQFDC